jgi:hypothetical protein
MLTVATVLADECLKQALPKGLDFGRGRRRPPDEADPPHLPLLLRLDSERRSEDPGQRGQQEAAAVHPGMVGQSPSRVNRPTLRKLDSIFVGAVTCGSTSALKVVGTRTAAGIEWSYVL